MDDARSSSCKPRPEPLPGWWAMARPIVRSISFRLGHRHRLQSCDRNDLEQELWLQLLVRHGGRQRGDHHPALSHPDALSHYEAMRSQLRSEVEQAGAALRRSWALWRRQQERSERHVPAGLLESLACHEVDRFDLSLDIAAIAAGLPAAQRKLCAMLMAGSPVPGADDIGRAHRLAALRAAFSALDLHHYC